MTRVQWMVLLATGMALLGCSSKDKADDATAKSVGSAATAIVPYATSGSSSGLRTYLREMARRAEGSAWAARFQAEADALAESDRHLMSVGESACPTAGDLDESGLDCSVSCDSDSEPKVITTSCQLTSDHTEVCNGTTYTYKNGSVDFTADFSDFKVDTESETTTISGSLKFALNVAAEVTGGDLAGGKLECDFAFDLDFAKLTDSDETNDSAFAPSCDNFSCSYADKEIECEQLQEAFESGNACEATEG